MPVESSHSRYSNKTIWFTFLYISDNVTKADCFAKAANYYDKAMFQMKRGGLAVTDPAYKYIVKNHKMALGVIMDERRLEQVEQFYQVSVLWYLIIRLNVYQDWDFPQIFHLDGDFPIVKKTLKVLILWRFNGIDPRFSNTFDFQCLCRVFLWRENICFLVR